MRIKPLISLLMVIAVSNHPVCMAQGDTDATPELRCAALQNVDLSDTQDAPTQVTASALVEDSQERLAYCRIEGYVLPQVGFELRLPVRDWNGRFIVTGNGGFGGEINGAICNQYLKRGYAC